jgi:hypothetical protein
LDRKKKTLSVYFGKLSSHQGILHEIKGMKSIKRRKIDTSRFAKLILSVFCSEFVQKNYADLEMKSPKFLFDP